MIESTQSAIGIPSRIFLVGFMGSGKTTVGRLLAERLDYRFIDLDDRIVDRAGKPITRIFAEDGEDAFRRQESDLLCSLMNERGAVISLGGGTFVSEGNRRVIKEHGVSIWLDCPFDVIMQRLEGTSDRPLYTSPEQFRELWTSRLPSYSKADYRIDASRVPPDELVEEIIGNMHR
jgi:shikimate kinase